MQPAFKPNPRAVPQFRAAMGELAALMKRDNAAGLQKLLRQSAGRFVRNAVDITAPAQGKADRGAKKRGELRILGDLLRIAQPVAGLSKKQALGTLSQATDLLALHARSRASRTGRVNPRSRKNKMLIEQREFVRAATRLQARVGWLAAGLNAAAQKLGVPLPAWIRRHGNKFGRIEVQFTATRLRIRIVQNVPYTNNVSGYARKWNHAFEREVRTIRAMVSVLHRKGVERARVRLR